MRENSVQGRTVAAVLPSFLSVMTWVKKEKEAGVVISADKEQEWLAYWFLRWFFSRNKVPVTLIDCGISAPIMKSLKDGYDLLDVKPGPKGLGWFIKPFAILQSVYEKTVWFDVDCRVRGNVGRLFECRDEEYIMLRRDEPYAKLDWANKLIDGEVMYNSGVVAVSHGHPVVPQWAAACRLGDKWFRGDQEVLSRVLRIYGKRKGWTVHDLPRSYNNLRLDEYQDPAAVVQHLTGPQGKREIFAEVRKWKEEKK